MAKNTKPRSQEFKDMLVTEYLNTNISIQELSAKYHTDAYYQLTKCGIKLKGRGVQKMLTRTGCINYVWNALEVATEEQAYTLGFLMADGYNTGAQVGIRLKECDRDIVEKMKNCFSKQIKLQYDGYSYSFVISSTIICNNLANLGVVKDKTHHEITIPNLNSNLIRHFIRGYFDGDGTVFICNTNGGILKCNFCSPTLGILEQIREILLSEGIWCTIDCEKRKGKTYIMNNQYPCVATMDMYRLFIRRKSAIEKLFHYLYDDATIYLSRKYEKFSDNREMFKYRKHVNTELTA